MTLLQVNMYATMDKENDSVKEEIKVTGEKVVEVVKKLIEEGNARKIIIKNNNGESLMEIPLTVGAVGVIAIPVLAAIGALAALVNSCTIVVIKKEMEKEKI